MYGEHSRVATKWPTTLARKGCPFLDLPSKTRRQHVLKIRLSDVEWAHLQNVFPKRVVGTSLRALAMDQPVRHGAIGLAR
jgi:hypothetical protein